MLHSPHFLFPATSQIRIIHCSLDFDLDDSDSPKFDYCVGRMEIPTFSFPDEWQGKNRQHAMLFHKLALLRHQ